MLLSTWAIVQAAPRAPGFVEVRMLPAESVATHSELEGHEIAVSESPPSTLSLRHRLAPAVGSVELITLPAPSTATHRSAAGQAIPLRATPSIVVGAVQISGPLTGG